MSEPNFRYYVCFKDTWKRAHSVPYYSFEGAMSFANKVFSKKRGVKTPGYYIECVKVSF